MSQSTTPQASSLAEKIAALELQLNHFDADIRSHALAELLALAGQGLVPLEPERDVVNMHCHTFFSFNAYAHSPTSLAWLAKRRGFRLIGIVDFDVVDGVEEFLAACDLAGVRGTAGVETRIYLPEFATREINSPGEPGVSYHMGIGFTGSDCPPEAFAVLGDLRQRAARRNREMAARVNAHLAAYPALGEVPVQIEYDSDVLPLTPRGNATERHMLAAYARVAKARAKDLAGFWADRLGVAINEVAAVLPDEPKFQNLVRSRLMKRGGAGYVQPGPDSFPGIDDFHRMIVACGALPCAAWLDGTSAGEQAIEELLELLIGKGVVALNIIPDRNWNIADAETRRIKVQKLYEIVRLAEQYDLPLNVGTEMNSYGQRLVDDFDAPELAPLRQSFIDGAFFVYGHTVLQRACGLGYQSSWAASHLPTRKQRNAFYTEVGKRVQPGQAGLDALSGLDGQVSPTQLLDRLGS